MMVSQSVHLFHRFHHQSLRLLCGLRNLQTGTLNTRYLTLPFILYTSKRRSICTRFGNFTITTTAVDYNATKININTAPLPQIWRPYISGLSNEALALVIGEQHSLTSQHGCAHGVYNVCMVGIVLYLLLIKLYLINCFPIFLRKCNEPLTFSLSCVNIIYPNDNNIRSSLLFVTYSGDLGVPKCNVQIILIICKVCFRMNIILYLNTFIIYIF